MQLGILLFWCCSVAARLIVAYSALNIIICYSTALLVFEGDFASFVISMTLLESCLQAR